MNKNACLTLFLALGMGMSCAFAEPLTLDPKGNLAQQDAPALPGSTLAPDPALAPLSASEPGANVPAPASFSGMAGAPDLSTQAPRQQHQLQAPAHERDLPEPVSAVLILLALSLLARAHRKQSD